MSTVYLEDSARGRVHSEQQLAEEAKRDIEAARAYRKRFEPTWKQNLAFASGQYWLQVDRFSRQLVMPQEYEGKELYSADVIGEYRNHVLGELGSDEDRPELLLAKEDQPSEHFQAQLNRAVAFGWEQEWDGDAALAQVRRMTVDLGTAAIRCRWNPAAGPELPGAFPHVNGKPVLKPEDQYQLFANGVRPDVQMQTIRRGKICWDPLSALNILVPPGVPHEQYFPWECIVWPTLVTDVQEEYGDAAADLKEDGDIGSILGDSSAGAGGMGPITYSPPGGGDPGRLRGYVWLFKYYRRPSKRWPQGLELTLGGNRMKLLDAVDHLPYVNSAGDYRSGIAYFHWWRVTGRFWSRGLLDVMKDIQRTVNKRRTQINEIIDRGMPFVIVETGSRTMKRDGSPVEFVEVDPSERQPVVVSGVGPGQWIQADVEACREDLEHATGIRGPRLGENPQNVSTYSQLALLNEQDVVKREPIIIEHKRAIAQLVEDSVHDIRTYWGPQRQIMLAGDDDQVDVSVFNATQIPAYFIVRAPKGTAKPRSQAAELKKIEDIARYSVESRMPVPPNWLKDSLDAGQALPLPEIPRDEQADKALLENHALLSGSEVPVAYYDPPGIHIPIHRSAQIQAELEGDQAAWQRIETHVRAHLLAVQQNMQQQQDAMPAPPAGELPIPAPPSPSAAQAPAPGAPRPPLNPPAPQ